MISKFSVDIKRYLLFFTLRAGTELIRSSIFCINSNVPNYLQTLKG